jgi:hypothetical protein
MQGETEDAVDLLLEGGAIAEAHPLTEGAEADPHPGDTEIAVGPTLLPPEEEALLLPPEEEALLLVIVAVPPPIRNAVLLLCEMTGRGAEALKAVVLLLPNALALQRVLLLHLPLSEVIPFPLI